MNYRSNEPREYQKDWAGAASQAGVHVGLTTLFLGMGVGGAVLTALGVEGGVAGLVNAFGGFLVIVGTVGTLIFARLSYSSIMHAVEEYFRAAGDAARDVARLAVMIAIGFLLFAVAALALNGESLLAAAGLGGGAP